MMFFYNLFVIKIPSGVGVCDTHPFYRRKMFRIRLMILNPVITPLKMATPELKLLIRALALFIDSEGLNSSRACSVIRCLDARIWDSFSAFCWQIISSVISVCGVSCVVFILICR